METTFADLYQAYEDGKERQDLDRLIVLDQEGDLWIDVGGGDDEQPANRKGVYRFRVGSEIMRHASPVFDALVSGPWQEEKPATAGDKRWVVALPDDHPLTTGAVLAMIYRQWDKLMTGYSRFVGRIGVMWLILSAAERYDVANLFWDHKTDWPEQAYPHLSLFNMSDSEGANLETLQQLAIHWQLGAVGLVEYSVRQHINGLSQETANALLALVEDAPSFGLPLSLRDLIRVIVEGRKKAIQSALDFFHRALADPNNKKLVCPKPKDDPRLIAEFQWRIGTPDGTGLGCGLSPSNATTGPYKGGCVIPTDSQHVFNGLKHVLSAIRFALQWYFPIGRMAILMSKEHLHPVHHAFAEFEVLLRDQWTQHRMGWDATSNDDEVWDKKWDSLDTFHAKYWMPMGYVLETEQVEWLKRRRNLLRERATKWDMGRWARSTAVALRDIT